MSLPKLTFFTVAFILCLECSAQDSTRVPAANFQSTRYFWLSNGFGLKKGEGYYQNVWGLFNQFSVGITKNISITAGTVPLLFEGSPYIPVWIAPKVSVPLARKVNLGVGVLYVGLFGDTGEGSTSTAMAHGILTLGGHNGNISFGGGYGLSGADFRQRPVYTLAGMVRVGKRGFLMTENYLFPPGNEEDGFRIISVGARRLMRKGGGLDFGLILPKRKGSGRGIPLPLFGFTLPIGKRYLGD